MSSRIAWSTEGALGHPELVRSCLEEEGERRRGEKPKQTDKKIKPRSREGNDPRQ